MEWLQSLGLLGLFIGTFLAATVLPFSSDALYLGILAVTGDVWGCLAVGTLGNWLGSVVTYWMGWAGKWEWIEKWFKVKPETLEKQKIKSAASKQELMILLFHRNPRILQRISLSVQNLYQALGFSMR